MALPLALPWACEGRPAPDLSPGPDLSPDPALAPGPPARPGLRGLRDPDAIDPSRLPAFALEPGHAPAPMALPMDAEPPQSYADFIAEGPPPVEPGRETVALLPIGEFPRGFIVEYDRVHLVRCPPLEHLGPWAARWLDLPVRVLPPLDDALLESLPTRELDGLRQLDAAALLAALTTLRPLDCGRLMALTLEDLFTPDSRWIYGYADPRAGVAVHSLLRYDPGFSRGAQDRPPDFEATIARRTLRVLSHELCHLFGLRHCVHFACVMNPTANLRGVDALPLRLCPVCLRKLDAAVGLELGPRWRDLTALAAAAGLDFEAQWYAARLSALQG